MEKHEQYKLEKTMLAYDKYIKGEYFKKARAVIIKDGKVAFIKNLSDGKITIPGGGVDEGEKIEDAVIREAFEETGIKVTLLFKAGENFYNVNMQLGDVEFVSKRVEYIYVCEYIDQIADLHGIEGEYAGKTEIYFDKPDKLKDCFVSEACIDHIKKYIKEYKSKE